MLKILKYLKGHLLEVLIIFCLLLVQVYCDLALPQYTSDLVDVGIQQAGIEDAVPLYMSGETKGYLELFMTEKDSKSLEKNFSPVEDSSLKVRVSDGLTASEKKEAEKIYKYTGEKENREKLSDILELPMLYVYAADKMQGKAGTSLADIRRGVYAGMVKKEDIRKNAEKELKKYGGDITSSNSLIEQAAISFVGEEYEKCGVDRDKIQTDYLWSKGLMMIALTGIMIIAAIIIGFFASKVGAQVGRDTRKRIFVKVLSFSQSEVNRFSTASLITRSTNDIQQIQIVIVIILRIVMMAPVMGIGACVKVMATHTGMGWITGIAVGAIFVLVAALYIVAMPKFRIMQTLIDRINLVSREILTGIPVIRAFSREDFEEARFAGASEDLRKTQRFTQRTMAFMLPAMMVIMNIISVGIVWFGAKGVDLGNLQVGDMIAFITYTMQVVISFMMLTVAAIIVPRASVAAERIEEVLLTETSVKDKAETVSIEDPKGRVDFHNVSFRYDGADDYVIEDISFTAMPGETTAVIGSTGSGKSTLISLIPRFYDVTEGSVTVDGVDVRDMKQEELRSMIGYVPQKGVLFSGDIRSNIKFASDDITDEEMEAAAQTAQAYDFITEKDDGFDSQIAQGGTNVSGGQRQRLSIARAIAKDPKIYIFDDSFSALDYRTDAALRKELSEKTKDAAVIIVAQRMATIMGADRILVLEEGRIVGEGTHRELLVNCSTYREIAESQLSEEDLKRQVSSAEEVLLSD